MLRLTLPAAGGWAASRLEGRAVWRPAQTTSEPFRFALASIESIWRCSVEFAVCVRVRACRHASVYKWICMHNLVAYGTQYIGNPCREH